MLSKGEPMERQWSERHWRTPGSHGTSSARRRSRGLRANRCRPTDLRPHDREAGRVPRANDGEGLGRVARRVRPAGDPVDRNFRADGPDKLRPFDECMHSPVGLQVADITCVPTWAGFISLSVLLDAFSGRIVGPFSATVKRSPAGQRDPWGTTSRRNSSSPLGTSLRDALPGDGRDKHGDRPAAARKRHSSWRSGISIHVRGVRPALQRGRRPAVDGIGRRRVRQRPSRQIFLRRIACRAMHARELLRHSRMRIARPAEIPRQGRGSHDPLRVHRRPVQPEPRTFGPRLQVPRHVR